MGSFYKFTGIQIVALAVLWVVKQTDVAISFPVFILLLIPLRMWLMPKLGISEEEFEVLDSEEDSSAKKTGSDRKFSEVSQSRSRHLSMNYEPSDETIKRRKKSSMV